MRVWVFFLGAAGLGVVGAQLADRVSVWLAIPMLVVAVLYGLAGAWWL